MKLLRSRRSLGALSLGMLLLTPLWLLSGGCAGQGASVEVPRGIDHAPYDRLLRRYVDERGWVNYRAWQAHAADLAALRTYTAQFAGGGPFATGAEKAASLINAYNALTIQWILERYPVASIRDTANPWKEPRWSVGGRAVALDEIEHATLRPEFGYRVHAVLVCAARSCPPLWNRAFQTAALDAQLDERMRAWLARPDLNRFDPAAGRMELSRIFSWYAADFDDLPAVIARSAPIACVGCRISYLPYDWALNEP